MNGWRGRVVVCVAALFTVAGCGEVRSDSNQTRSQALTGIPSSFDQDNIMSDDVFEGRTYPMDVGLVQAFLETSPYNTRSWLADANINGVPASQAIIDAAVAHDVNPIVLLTRMQAEQGLVSATARPDSDRRVDYAFGCGCHDNQPCNVAFKGLDKQLECGAQALRNNFERSVTQEGSYFHKDKAKGTLDGHTVTPANHATASHYNYTPHRSAADLTWQILSKYARHVETLAPVDPPDPGATSWIGEHCDAPDRCALGDPVCLPSEAGGMCTQACEGTCPDKSGYATTFCVEVDGTVGGVCVQRADAANNFCADLPGTERATVDRYIGSSSSSPSSREVCFPLPPAPEDPMDPMDPVDPADPMDPMDSVDPVTPEDPMDPVAPDNPGDPGEPSPMEPAMMDPADEGDAIVENPGFDDDDEIIVNGCQSTGQGAPSAPFELLLGAFGVAAFWRRSRRR